LQRRGGVEGIAAKGFCGNAVCVFKEVTKEPREFSNNYFGGAHNHRVVIIVCVFI